MGRYDHFKKPKPTPKAKQKKVVRIIRYVLVTLILLTEIAIFILQVVMNQKK